MVPPRNRLVLAVGSCHIVWLDTGPGDCHHAGADPQNSDAVESTRYQAAIAGFASGRTGSCLDHGKAVTVARPMPALYDIVSTGEDVVATLSIIFRSDA